MKKMNLKIILKIVKYLLIFSAILFLVGIFGIYHKKVTSQPLTKPTLPPKQQEAKFTDFHLLIPSLNISAPVIPDVPGDNKTAYFKALENGVAQYQGTKKPGEGGNIFIFGHSSYYVWAPGDYKDIFKNLEDIKGDDEIDLWWQGKEYKYQVIETKVVEPTDVSVLNPTKTEQVTLMTCVPVGTTKQRLIVIAKPI